MEAVGGRASRHATTPAPYMGSLHQPRAEIRVTKTHHEGTKNTKILQNEALDALFQKRNVEIDKQPNRNPCQLHVRQCLRFVNRQQALYAFILNNKLSSPEQINPKSAIETYSFVLDG